MLPLICVLGAPPPKPKTPVDEDTEEELDDRESDRVSLHLVCVHASIRCNVHVYIYIGQVLNVWFNDCVLLEYTQVYFCTCVNVRLDFCN